ncbi:phospholipase/carboxylesterase [Bacteriovorax sp. BAL6_X]|uniref:acyl-CoA thioester hydrolase/BAAT C-terminal domain-containing protein n=1 Tax=Bacteriovorax sp. BAL6_X TaxID=1201290 RepID=UPI000385F73F|nr:acyl-CoA thioester hydrolase/BAAT C-terminal domain-containing protein [Bacteriovorax sp. BAL6_X]EPZ51392.1 phospholipase/carboxylesterase [Bacteriovorax sp. BAL6_X]
MENNTSRTNVGTNLPIDSIEMGNPKAQRTLLVLHGFAQNNEQIKENIIDKLSSKIVENFRILIPNGIFPIPKIRPNQITYRYSWYFYDHTRQSYYIDMNTPIEALGNLLKAKAIEFKNVTIIGYSQGGYLAPIMASYLPGIHTSIAINANTRVDKLGENLNFKHLSIHNEGDPVVEFKNSHNSFLELRKKIADARFESFEINSHEITPENIKVLESYLLEIK